MNKILLEKIKDALRSILPVVIVIFIVSLFVGVPGRELAEFGFGALILILGVILFSLGADTSMMPIAQKIGQVLTEKRKLFLLIFVVFIIGFLIAIAEPTLWVLADQFQAIPTSTLLVSVAVGVGTIVVIALLRIIFQFNLSYILLIGYGLIFILSFLVPSDFVPVAFDSGGVSTGPITVPFIMALGLGVAASRGDKGSHDDSFGLVGITLIGPVVAVLILALFHGTDALGDSEALSFGAYFIKFIKDIAIALLPFILFFITFQIFGFKFSKRVVMRIVIGFIYTYFGLVLFLTGANAGFLSVGGFIGGTIASYKYKFLLIPVGMLFGFTIVAAEPTVIVLTKQVEEVTSGAISRKVMNISLSVGVSLAVGLACLRILLGFNILYILIPGYLFVIAASFYVPKLFTAIAVDSSACATGAMTASFLVPFAIGAAEAIGGNVLANSFGIIGIITISPFLTLQVVGLIYRFKSQHKKIEPAVGKDEIIELSEV